MSSLKLVIWDLDETLVDGVYAEGDRVLARGADALVRRLHEQGVLQALATQNDRETMESAISTYGWEGLFQAALADFGPKATKVSRILTELDIAPTHTVFVDDDPFERESVAAQIDGLGAFALDGIAALADSMKIPQTEESRRRPQMYDELARRREDGDAAENYEDFLASCDMRLTIRAYRSSDEDRVVELLERTNRMNLGATLSPSETVVGLSETGPRIVVAELRDRYGDSGRCGVLRLTPAPDGSSARIDSLALSCRVRARGLALSMLVALLRHPDADHPAFEAEYRSTGRNRPLRMLLWAAGFEDRGDGWLHTTRERLDDVELPDWLRIDVESVTGPSAR